MPPRGEGIKRLPLLSERFLVEHGPAASCRRDICSMRRITTHVLDTAAGRPAAGLKVVLTRLDGKAAVVAETVTNADGRCDKPLLDDADFAHAVYPFMFQ